jgi:hypothetical protein
MENNIGLTSDDKSHLDALGICYYVMAGFSALGVLFGLLYLGMGIFFAVMFETAGQAGPNGRLPGLAHSWAAFLL